MSLYPLTTHSGSGNPVTESHGCGAEEAVYFDWKNCPFNYPGFKASQLPFVLCTLDLLEHLQSFSATPSLTRGGLLAWSLV